ncbi:secretin N-terminal domain-containing protein [Planctomycetota bacterium]
MKTRMILITFVAILSLSVVLPAQDTAIPVYASSLEEQAVQVTPPGRSRRRNAEMDPFASAPPKSSQQVRIFNLKYANAEEMAALLADVLSMPVNADPRTNCLIVATTNEDKMESIEKLVIEMDVSNAEAPTSPVEENLVYRIYMFEIPTGDQSMRSFSLILQASEFVSSQDLLNATANQDLQINKIQQDDHALLVIQGKATSKESLTGLLEHIPESYIKELRWDDDESFTNKIAVAQSTQLPVQMQKHLEKFLGKDLSTVGYWFGNASAPGEIEAPIGPWTLRLDLEIESDQMAALRIEVEIPDNLPGFIPGRGPEHNDEILSNTVRVRIGKPIIIGYNRESYGTRKMGALVIIPEQNSF